MYLYSIFLHCVVVYGSPVLCFISQKYDCLTAVYLHSPTISLDEPILDRKGSYTHEQHSFTRRYA